MKNCPNINVGTGENFTPPRSKIGAHFDFVLCHSVLLSETLTLLITFDQRVLELLYFTWIFSMIRPFSGYHYFVTLVTLTLEFDPFFENFNLFNNFWTASARALIFQMNNPCDKTFPWVPLFFLLYYLDLGVFWKLTLLIILTVSAKNFMFTWVFLSVGNNIFDTFF